MSGNLKGHLYLTRLFFISVFVLLLGSLLIYLLIWWKGGNKAILEQVLRASIFSLIALVGFLFIFHIYGDKRTPLHVAAAKGQSKKVEALLAKGANVSAKTKYGWTALHEAAGFGNKTVAEILISKGADINAKDKNGQTPLHWAVLNGNVNLVELLIAKDAKINIRNNENKTPIDVAIENNNKPLAELFNKLGV